MRERLFRKILGTIEYRDPKWVRLLEIRILKGLAERSFGMRSRDMKYIADRDLQRGEAGHVRDLQRDEAGCARDLQRGEAAHVMDLQKGAAGHVPAVSSLTERLKFADPDAALRQYAEFTASCMSSAAACSDPDGYVKTGTGEAGSDAGGAPDTELPDRLYQEAFRLGSLIRRITGFRDRRDLDRLIFCLYRNIDISMSGSTDCGLIVSGCFFSEFYTPWQCRLMSCVDSGVIAGICGGGRLEFTERITEGCGRCRACLLRE